MTGPHHTLTEPASDAAIDTACRVLRLPTMRAQFADTVARAEREHLSYRGFLAELLGFRLHSQPERHPGPDQQPRHLRMSQEGRAALLDR